MPDTILVVDDEPVALEGLELTLSGEGYRVRLARSAAEAMTILGAEPCDLVITDLRMPGQGGLELLDLVKATDPLLSVIIVTGYASVDSAVAALRKGAYDYLTKPFNLEAVRAAVRRALDHRRLNLENKALQHELSKVSGAGGIVMQSRAMQDLLKVVRQVASSSANVLITGESGTGKEVIARALHVEGARASRRFLALHCASLPETLLANELFGHEKGAFTDAKERKVGLFEAAQGGTVFLDEVAEIPLSAQATLLRVLQEREVMRVGGTTAIKVDFRLVAATNQDLEAMVAQSRFRNDLYYRLNVIPMRIEPLRERPEDIEPLALHFAARFRDREGKRITGISPEAMTLLKAYAWPGNVRELENVIERAVILCRGERIGQTDLPPALLKPGARGTGPIQSMEEHSKAYILESLEKMGGSVTRTARALGIDRTTLWRKLKGWGIKDAGPRDEGDGGDGGSQAG